MSHLLHSLISLSFLTLEPQPQATEQESAEGQPAESQPEGQPAETQPESQPEPETKPEGQPEPESQPEGQTAEIEPADPQPAEVQKDEVKEGGGEPETKETEPTTQGEKGEQKVEDEPKSKPLPSRTRVRTIVPEEGVDLAMGESGLESEEPITVGKLFQDTVKRIPAQPALKYKEDGTWKTITFSEYYDLCIKAAKSFLKVSGRAN